MGKVNNVINNYFKDKPRFADLFNGICFQGCNLIKPEQLIDVSTTYYPMAPQKTKSASPPGSQANRKKRKKTHSRKEYLRDIRMQLDTGETLRLLALENQDSIDYTMPFRCMQYDTFEYNRQLSDLRRKNTAENTFVTPAERLCKVKKTDRLHPIYTICMYHGEDVWDGPRTLRDMMDFGEDFDGMSRYFKDYPLFLYCLNEERDFSNFHGDVRTLFTLLQYRTDKMGLLQQLEHAPEAFRHLNEETLEVASVMMNTPSIWTNRENYLNQENGTEEYDVCLAIRELMKDKLEEGIGLGIERGIEQGIEQKTILVIRNMLLEGMTDESIKRITLCNQEMINQVRAEMVP